MLITFCYRVQHISIGHWQHNLVGEQATQAQITLCYTFPLPLDLWDPWDYTAAKVIRWVNQHESKNKNYFRGSDSYRWQQNLCKNLEKNTKSNVMLQFVIICEQLSFL